MALNNLLGLTYQFNDLAVNNLRRNKFTLLFFFVLRRRFFSFISFFHSLYLLRFHFFSSSFCLIRNIPKLSHFFSYFLFSLSSSSLHLLAIAPFVIFPFFLVRSFFPYHSIYFHVSFLFFFLLFSSSHI